MIFEKNMNAKKTNKYSIFLTWSKPRAANKLSPWHARNRLVSNFFSKTAQNSERPPIEINHRTLWYLRPRGLDWAIWNADAENLASLAHQSEAKGAGKKRNKPYYARMKDDKFFRSVIWWFKENPTPWGHQSRTLSGNALGLFRVICLFFFRSFVLRFNRSDVLGSPKRKRRFLCWGWNGLLFAAIRRRYVLPMNYPVEVRVQSVCPLAWRGTWSMLNWSDLEQHYVSALRWLNCLYEGQRE